MNFLEVTIHSWWFAFGLGVASFPLMVVLGTFFFFLHLELAERRMAKVAKVQQMRETLRFKKDGVSSDG